MAVREMRSRTMRIDFNFGMRRALLSIHKTMRLKQYNIRRLPDILAKTGYSNKSMAKGG